MLVEESVSVPSAAVTRVFTLVPEAGWAIVTTPPRTLLPTLTSAELRSVMGPRPCNERSLARETGAVVPSSTRAPPPPPRVAEPLTTTAEASEPRAAGLEMTSMPRLMVVTPV